jgi:hypothetical protein
MILRQLVQPEFERLIGRAVFRCRWGSTEIQSMG